MAHDLFGGDRLRTKVVPEALEAVDVARRLLRYLILVPLPNLRAGLAGLVQHTDDGGDAWHRHVALGVGTQASTAPRVERNTLRGGAHGCGPSMSFSDASVAFAAVSSSNSRRNWST